MLSLSKLFSPKGGDAESGSAAAAGAGAAAGIKFGHWNPVAIQRASSFHASCRAFPVSGGVQGTTPPPTLRLISYIYLPY